MNHQKFLEHYRDENLKRELIHRFSFPTNLKNAENVYKAMEKMDLSWRDCLEVFYQKLISERRIDPLERVLAVSALCINALRKRQNLPSIPFEEILKPYNTPQESPSLPNKQENNTMDTYAQVPVAKPTLVFGKDIKKLSESQLVVTLREINKAKEDLQDLTGTNYGATKLAELDAATTEVVALLDGLVSKTEASEG